MTRYLLFLFSAYLLSLGPVQATVISRDWKDLGDGLLTYDTINQREWLDLTETQLFQFPGQTFDERFQSIENELLPGGMFETFVIAKSSDVFALAESAGIDTSTTNLARNEVPAQELISLLGATSGTSVSHGTYGSIGGRTGYFTGHAIFRHSGAAGIEFRLGQLQVGVWLYRQIPEPTSVTLIALAILIGCTTRQKF